MSGIFWTAVAFAVLGVVAITGCAIHADRKGGSDAAGMLFTGTMAFVVCEVVAVVLGHRRPCHWVNL